MMTNRHPEKYRWFVREAINAIIAENYNKGWQIYMFFELMNFSWYQTEGIWGD